MRPEAPFEEPWQAQLFALTVGLSEQGLFGWPDWTEAFGAVLARTGTDGGESYWLAWLEALEGFLETRGLAEATALRDLKAAWEAAYLATPHGQPVRL